MAKPALPLLDIPLGAFGLARLVEAAGPVVVNVSHLPDSVTEALAAVVPQGRGWSSFLEKPPALGTAGTLAALAGRLRDPALVYNGDLLADIDPAALLEAHRNSGARATVAIRPVTSGADLTLDGARVTGFVDRRDRVDAGGALYLGVAVFHLDVIEAIPSTVPLGLGESVLSQLAERGELAMWQHDAYALDIGTPARYLAATMELLHGRGPRPPIPWPGRIIEDTDGLAYVGEGADVEPASLSDGAVVLRGATVERGARIGRSIVWPGERVPADSDLDGVVWIEGRAIPC